jgi:ArsR family transcriptional regulator, lead/cadmium/zinc/bismuth-responsive transcriptional repressor
MLSRDNGDVMGARAGFPSAHPAPVERVLKAMPSAATIEKVGAIFGMLADPTRARLVFALSREELCVGDLAALLGMTMSAVSHQLRLLRQMDLVKHRKQGRMAFYSLGDEHAHALLAEALRHAAHTPSLRRR